MATQDPSGKMKYWYEATSCSLIRIKKNASIGTQSYWYNGQPQGFLLVTTFTPKPRYFAVLLGF